MTTAKTGLDALLTPQNSVLVLIDHQPFQFANLHSHEPTMILNNVIGLAKAAKVFRVPTILTTVVEERGGYLEVDASSTMDALNDRGISVTRFVSSGGFLQHKNVTLMSGIDDDRIEEVLGLIKENCRTRSEFMNPMPPLVEPGDFFVPYPVEVQVGGATVFIVNVDRFEKL